MNSTSSTKRRPEVWLRGNRRAYLASLALPLVLICAAVAALFFWSEMGTLFRVGAVMVAVVGGLLMLTLLLIGRYPRLAFDGECLLAFLRFDGPCRVPIEYVECFLLEKSLTPLGTSKREVETSQLVVRIAERASEWQTVEVQPALGKWCGGYLTIRGMWCERLDLALVNRLNARLAEVQRQRAAKSLVQTESARG